MLRMLLKPSLGFPCQFRSPDCVQRCFLRKKNDEVILKFQVDSLQVTSLTVSYVLACFGRSKRDHIKIYYLESCLSFCLLSSFARNSHCYTRSLATLYVLHENNSFRERARKNNYRDGLKVPSLRQKKRRIIPSWQLEEDRQHDGW